MHALTDVLRVGSHIEFFSTHENIIMINFCVLRKSVGHNNAFTKKNHDKFVFWLGRQIVGHTQNIKNYQENFSCVVKIVGSHEKTAKFIVINLILFASINQTFNNLLVKLLKLFASEYERLLRQHLCLFHPRQ